ncbi:hypothetical protein [Nostoc sp.]|uniref:hypothetical protein n=1 Tax=Nostoc sp. TaxID=1180 RepID=UPI0035945AE8
MEHWQFLIQKQGDRSWHILESPNLKILEGQYRVLARSNLSNIDVEVRVTHSSTQEIHPKPRIFKRSRRINSEGLMAVIPFTYLGPGVWELRCSSDLMWDMLGKSWQYSVQLQVLSQGESGEEEKKGLSQAYCQEPDYPAESEATSVYVETLDQAIAVFAEQVIATESNPTTVVPNEVVPNETEEDIIDQPVSPVWLKGETAEQILQNLIELTLPTSELLSQDEQVTDSSATQPPPLLLLTLDQDTYIARWGEALEINGHIELKKKIELGLVETFSSKRLRAIALLIELRSPLESKILTQLRQPLPDQELPFTINASIDIPAECESKLILADISLYGRLADVGEVIRLASESFTITADVTELLAITAAAKTNTSLNDPTALSDSSLGFTEPEAAVRLDLKLFNLVKIPKIDESQRLNPSPNISLPPQINLQVLQQATLRTSKPKNSTTLPQLPKLPPVQTDANTPTDVVAKPPTQEELLEKDTTIAAINLEQLVIRQRRIPILDATFPYLRRLQAVSDDTEKEVESNVSNGLKAQAPEDFAQLDTIVAEDENIPELVIGDAQFPEESVAEVAPQPNAQFPEESVAEVEPQTNAQSMKMSNLYSSPLLKKWMQSQGYYEPESINDLQPEDYDNYVLAPQMPLSLSAETPNVDVNLSLSLDDDTEIWQDADTAKKADLEIGENTEVEKVSEEVTLSPPPPPPIKINIASAWLAQEIVVDDTYSELEIDATRSYSVEEEKSDSSPSLPIITAAIEPLPIPELYVPDGELIAGKSIIIRVVLPEVPPQVVVKLWVEDYQTRCLLDGPHLLTNLLPNALGGLEVMTQLNIPFGCLEIRLEAIALDQATQQESHKVTIVRTVIPPDLPNWQLDELLGI